jgi:hypothetical protein
MGLACATSFLKGERNGQLVVGGFPALDHAKGGKYSKCSIGCSITGFGTKKSGKPVLI